MPLQTGSVSKFFLHVEKVNLLMPLSQAFLSWVFVPDQNLYIENIVFLKSVLTSTNYPAQMWLFINNQNSEPWCPGDLWYLSSKLPEMHPTTLPGTFLQRQHWWIAIISPVCTCPGDWLTCCCQKKWIITAFSQFLFPRTRDWISLFNKILGGWSNGTRRTYLWVWQGDQ